MVLFTPDQVYSRRHSPTWLLLRVLVQGCVNAAAVLACGRFVTQRDRHAHAHRPGAGLATWRSTSW